MKKIVVFGATGMTGISSIDVALKKGLQVRAVTRDPRNVPARLRDKVEVFKANVLEQEGVNKAVEGTDGVVICLGTGSSLGPTTDMSEGTKNIVKAMQANKVNVVSACISAQLLLDPKKVPSIYRALTDDHKRMYEALRDSPLNYIAVFPPDITSGSNGELVIEVDPTGPPRTYSVNKNDLAKFLVDSLDDPQYYRHVVALSNGSRR